MAIQRQVQQRNGEVVESTRYTERIRPPGGGSTYLVTHRCALCDERLTEGNGKTLRYHLLWYCSEGKAPVGEIE